MTDRGLPGRHRGMEVRDERTVDRLRPRLHEGQDLTAQRDALAGLGVAPERVYLDHGLTGTNRDRPLLRGALAACRDGDTLVVTKLDRLGRSLPDARAIADELTVRHVTLSLSGAVYDPTDPVGRLLFNVLAMVAPSTISREIARNSDAAGYRATTAQARAHERAGRPKPAKLYTNVTLRERVQADLVKKYSPEQIAGRLRKDYPTDPEMWVSAETIDQSLRAGPRRAAPGPGPMLRTGRALRIPNR